MTFTIIEMDRLILFISIQLITYQLYRFSDYNHSVFCILASNPIPTALKFLGKMIKFKHYST